MTDNVNKDLKIWRLAVEFTASQPGWKIPLHSLRRSRAQRWVVDTREKGKTPTVSAPGKVSMQIPHSEASGTASVDLVR